MLQVFRKIPALKEGNRKESIDIAVDFAIKTSPQAFWIFRKP